VIFIGLGLVIQEIPDHPVSDRQGVANLSKPSVVVVSQVATVDKSRLLQKIGTLSREKIVQVIEGCQQVISLKIFD
jgi:mRNA-degrading endonuclease toxin of MazEF toxin-antitoxin module